MQQAIPKMMPWLSAAAVDKSAGPTQGGSSASTENTAALVTKLVSENALVVLGRRGCCMCHAMKKLLQGLGGNPTVFDVFDEEDEAVIIQNLSKVLGVDADHTNGKLEFPGVFIGGEWFGGLEKVISSHIKGGLVPKLRDAKALWL